jgi:hypothetical protein
MSKLIRFLGQSGAVAFVIFLTFLLAIFLIAIPIAIAYNDVVQLIRPPIDITTGEENYDDW